MQDSSTSGEKPIKEAQERRARKAKLECASNHLTERKRAEKLLRKERARAQKYLDIAGVMLVAVDVEERVGLINKKGCEILGYKEEVIGKNWFDNFLPQRIKHQVRGVFEKLIRPETDGPEYYENLVLTKDGNERLMAWHNTVLRNDENEVIAILSSGEDITERKRTEEALKKTEEERSIVLNSMLEHMVHRDRKMRILWANKAACESVGLTTEQLAGRYCYEIWHQRSEPCVVCPAKKAMKTGQGQEMEVTTPDGRVWLIRAGPVRDANGEITGTINTTLEITQRKEAEQNLRQSEERIREQSEFLRNTLESLKHPFYVIDANDYTIKMANTATAGVEALPEGKTCYALTHGLDKPCAGSEHYCPVEQIKKTKKTMVVEHTHYDKDGKKRIFEVRAHPIFDKEGNVSQVIEYTLDITERKHAEQKLLEDQAKLKSLASQLTLAEERERRRIATELHDRIGQSLVISKMNLEALRKSSYGQEFDRTLDEICNTLGQTIANTRTLTFDLSSPILYQLGFETAVAEWLTEQIQDKHGIATEFEDDGRPKPLDDDIRVLLFRNVRELLINVVKHAHAQKVKVSIRKVGRQISVSVEDDGVGFDPAETASTAAKRAEFGLFSIRQRLEELGGHLEIESEPGRGCKVTMMAPLKQE